MNRYTTSSCARPFTWRAHRIGPKGQRTGCTPLHRLKIYVPQNEETPQIMMDPLSLVLGRKSLTSISLLSVTLEIIYTIKVTFFFLIKKPFFSPHFNDTFDASWQSLRTTVWHWRRRGLWICFSLSLQMLSDSYSARVRVLTWDEDSPVSW